MKKTSQLVLLFLVTSTLTLSAVAQQSGGDPVISPAKLKKMPSMKAPPEAKKSGLGGKVNVLVNIRKDGTVSTVESVSGPDWVCPSVTRADVVAIREAAKRAAMKVAFEPAMKNGERIESSMFITFNFPQKNESKESQAETKYTVAPDSKTTSEGDDPEAPRSYTIKGDAALTSPAGNPPTYKGPIATVGGNDVRTIRGGVLNHKARELPKPAYPPAARAVRASGAVTVQVLIDEKGDIFSAEPISGHPLLRSVSIVAACGTKFGPTTLSRQPVKVSGVITYNFVP